MSVEIPDNFNTDLQADFLPVQLRNVAFEVRMTYEATTFHCSCGGECLPFTMELGICIHCKVESILAELEYDVREEY